MINLLLYFLYSRENKTFVKKPKARVSMYYQDLLSTQLKTISSNLEKFNKIENLIKLKHGKNYIKYSARIEMRRKKVNQMILNLGRKGKTRLTFDPQAPTPTNKRKGPRWFKAKKLFLLQKSAENNGKLFCEYCFKEDLVLQIPHGAKQEHNMLTIDHIISLKHGGAEFDLENFAISCADCNQVKGSLH